MKCKLLNHTYNTLTAPFRFNHYIELLCLMMFNSIGVKLIQLRDRIILLPLTSWILDKSILPAASHVLRLREFIQSASDWEAADQCAREIVKDMRVLNGPFKNMMYPAYASVGSTLTPKLLGSYESEIASLVEDLTRYNYAQVIDIGCAEGYYAVGFALRNPDIAVFAYDISPSAREQCEAMARANGVDSRVFINSYCTPETLLTFPYQGQTLIIADCEGYEKYLFTEQVVRVLKNVDVLIESHDFLDIEITSLLVSRFQNSHATYVYKSEDDIDKAYNCKIDQLSGLPLSVKKVLLSEGRPSVMKWLFFASRKRVSLPLLIAYLFIFVQYVSQKEFLPLESPFPSLYFQPILQLSIRCSIGISSRVSRQQA
ncbi:MAG: methyltransferase domain-containing protein [Sphaerospermopsis kisseleviana]